MTLSEAVPVGLDPAEPDGWPEKDVLRYMVGIDYFGIPDTFVTLQFFQQFRGGNLALRLVPQVEEFTTLLVRHDFANDDWQAQVRWIASHDDNDGIIQAKLSWFVDDAWTVIAGADLFYGRQTGVFGQFDQADRLTLLTRFSF